MKRRAFFSGALRRGGAVCLAAGTLWAAAVTAGSDTFSEAWTALRASAPQGILHWELGDLWQADQLSAAAALAIGESPLLLSARPAVAELWSSDRAEQPEAEGETEEIVTEPVTETPLEAPEAADNGVAARTLVPTDPSGYTVCGSVYISNSTDHALTVSELTEPFDARLVDGSPQILILHSHGSESYTPAGDTEVVWSGDHRTTDTRYNVVKVGDEMAEEFTAAGISVLHDRTLYDYPSYSGAYDRSLAAIESYLAQYPSIRFILDIHRDAIADSEGNQYKVVSTVEGEGFFRRPRPVPFPLRETVSHGVPPPEASFPPPTGGGIFLIPSFPRKSSPLCHEIFRLKRPWAFSDEIKIPSQSGTGFFK